MERLDHTANAAEAWGENEHPKSTAIAPKTRALGAVVSAPAELLEPDYTRLRTMFAPIADRPLFCVYTVAPRAGKPGKYDKIPYVLGNLGAERLTGSYADPRLPERLMALDAAIALAQSEPRFHGVGLVFYPGCGVVGVDFDRCIVGDALDMNDTQRQAVALVKAHSAAEKSVSGTGLHLFALGDATSKKNDPAGLEVFGDKWFVALTGAGAKGLMQRLPDEVIGELMKLVEVDRGGGASMSLSGPAYLGAADACINRDVLPERPPVTADEVRAMLAYVSADVGREKWMLVVWAVEEGLGDDGEDIAREWSRTSARYTDEGFDNVWNSDRQDGARVTIGTLIKMATDAGYVPSWRQPTELAYAGPEGQVEVEVVPIMQTLNDAGNAQRIARAAAGRTKFFAARNAWATFEGGRWRVDTCGAVRVDAARALRNSIFDEAKACADSEVAKRVVAHGTNSPNYHRIVAALELAKGLPGMTVAPGETDADPFALQTRDGMRIDLRTGSVRPVEPGDHMLLATGCDFDADATCPRLERFMSEVMEGDAEEVAHLQRLVGYCLTGDTREQVFVFLHGSGSNGKSVFIAMLNELFGDYAKPVLPEMYLAQRPSSAEGASPMLAGLLGVRLALSSETEEGQRLAEGRIKQLTGGDPIVARHLHAAPFEFTPCAKHVMSVNYRPVVTGDDHGIWRRLRVVPFNRRFDEGDRDPELLQKLRAELPGILNWAVRGTQEWLRDGLRPPAKVRAEVERYRSDMDLLGQWLDECVRRDGGASMPARQAYQNYALWCSGSYQSATADVV